MGNSELQKSSFEQNNWKNIQESQNRRILYNDISMKSVERHEAQLDCDQGEAISICKWRESLPQDSCVVDLYQFGIKKAGMCHKQSKLYVITERIHLLSEIGAVSRPQAFLILRNIAAGLKILFRKFGNFDPKPNYMGINTEGKAKVWTNQNFAISQPQKNSNFPISSSEPQIVNNIIKILEQKTSEDNRFPIDFPKNLDLSLVVGYVNKVFTSLNGFEVDRVYIDRAQFGKKYKELKQRQQWEQKSKILAKENEKRVLQIQLLHQSLRMQQIQLAKRERQFRMQAEQAQIQRKLQIYRQVEAQRLFEIQRPANPSAILNQPHNQIISENSQGKILKRTVSTFRSEAFNSRVHSNTHQILNHPHQMKNNQIQGRPPLPPRQIDQVHPSTNKHLNTNISPYQNYNQQRIKKDIQMVDSMVMMHDEMADEPDKNFVESRIVTYKI